MKKKILQLTDLHMETNKNIEKINIVFERKIADIIVLTGDIDNGVDSLPFIKKLIKHNYTVIYVLGNNECYNYYPEDVISEWRTISEQINNFYFLEGDSVIIEDIEFFGTCLWTSVGTKHREEKVNEEEEKFLHTTRQFKLTKGFTCEKMKNTFYDKVEQIEKLIKNSKADKKVVLSHYLPSSKSIDQKYRNSKLTNIFKSDLEWLIEKYDINYWFHGHTHSLVNYKIFNTQIICNPYGRKEDNNLNYTLEKTIIKL
jgi:Icc-related predicted phosphoesterase